jgi:hypothetical protein
MRAGAGAGCKDAVVGGGGLMALVGERRLEGMIFIE